MRLVFDVTPLSVPRTGIGNYVLGSLRGAVPAAVAGGHELVAVALGDTAALRRIEGDVRGLGVELRTLRRRSPNLWRRGWAAAGRPGLERLIGPFDALHVTDWWHPPQRGGVRATTIHDLIPLRFPEWTTLRTRLAHRLGYRHARRCDVVFANSRATAADAVAVLRLPEERLRVAYPGVDRRFRPHGDRADLGAPYVLSVATLEPRKNLGVLLAASELLGGDLRVAVVGAKGWGDVPELDAPRVQRLGYVSDDELARLYRGAAAFAFPSRFEGFGMPVVEAMASGTPVVASAHPSLDEACGDAALRADPDDPAAFAAALEHALRERETLAARGLEHAQGFTWERTGRAFVDGLVEAAERG